MLKNAKHPRALIALCVVTVAAIAATAAFEAEGGFAAPQGNPVAEVQTAFSDHLTLINTMNTTAIEQEYSSDAKVSFTDKYETFNYTGLKGIGIAYGADVFPNFAVPKFSEINTSVKVDGKTATVDSTFIIYGYDSDGGPQSARVTAQLEYGLDKGSWLISFEAWNLVFSPGQPTDNEDP